MKTKLFFITVFAIIGLSANAQYSLFINFENTSTVKYAKIDTANHNNIWQIGKPSKTVFDSAYSVPNAIVTDTILPYPVNNHSSFIITIKSTTYWFMGSPSTLSFYHKFNTDQGKDGGYIDVSYDGGNKWQNIIYDTILSSCPTGIYDSLPSFYNLYSKTDTIIGGIPAFSGNSNGWEQTSITWLFCIGVKSWPPDSVMFRFNFVSDAIQTNKDGWMIDNINFNISECSGIKYETPTGYFQTHIFPNPTSSNLTIESLQKSTIDILNIQGQTILQQILQQGKTDIDISGLAKGVYILRLCSNDKSEVARIVKE